MTRTLGPPRRLEPRATCCPDTARAESCPETRSRKLDPKKRTLGFTKTREPAGNAI